MPLITIAAVYYRRSRSYRVEYTALTILLNPARSITKKMVACMGLSRAEADVFLRVYAERFGALPVRWSARNRGEMYVKVPC